MCLSLPSEVRRGHQIPWNWNYGWLWVTVWMIGIELRPSVRAASAQTTEPSLQSLCLCFYFVFTSNTKALCTTSPHGKVSCMHFEVLFWICCLINYHLVLLWGILIPTMKLSCRKVKWLQASCNESVGLNLEWNEFWTILASAWFTLQNLSILVIRWINCMVLLNI